jgi:hypothetical protein
MNKEQLKQEIKFLIGKDKLEKALLLLSRHIVDNEELDDLIIQQARYNRIKQNATNGTASKDELNNEMNALGRHILTFVRDEDWKLKTVEDITEELRIDDFQTNLAMSMTRMTVGALFLTYYEKEEAITIRTIMEETKLKSRKLVYDFLNELLAYKLVTKKKVKATIVWILNEEGKKRLSNIIK